MVCKKPLQVYLCTLLYHKTQYVKKNTNMVYRISFHCHEKFNNCYVTWFQKILPKEKNENCISVNKLENKTIIKSKRLE